MVNILFLDLDGTVRETVSGKPFINTYFDQRVRREMWKPLTWFHERGWKLIGVTNQRGSDPTDPEAINPHTGKTWKTFGEIISTECLTLEMLPLLSYTLMCPDAGQTCYKLSIQKGADSFCMEHFSTKKEGFRKPSTGMWELVQELEGEGIGKVIMTGDRVSDREFAMNCGIPFFWENVFHTLHGINPLSLIPKS